MVKWTLSLTAGLLLVNALLLAAHWVFPPPGGTPWIALEAGFLVGLTWLAPRSRRGLRLVVTAAAAATVALLSALALADAATWVIFARPLNLYLDLPLASSVNDLLSGILGPQVSLLVLLLAFIAAVGITALVGTLLWWGRPPRGLAAAVRLLPGLGGTRPRRAELLGAAALGLPMLVALVLPRAPLSGAVARAPRVGAPAVQLLVAQAGRLAETLREEEAFEELLAEAPAGYGGVAGLFERLEGRDVVLAFIESYGVSAIDDPRYAPVIGPRLEAFGRQMEAAGVALASGTLVAPTQGGQSWFSHGSLLSGLWLDNQLRYDLMLGSGRETLIDDFRSAGYETVALVPAITFAWPEGERLRYDRILARADIPYAGPPFNWVTMPDQYSWHFLERKIRGEEDEAAGRRPVFVEASLISSHAPWTPILPVLEDWESIGDGRVFHRWAGAGERPEELWLDQERVREHFALSVDYALGAMASYAERFADERLLLIVLGDHQPAPLVTGEGVSWEVPMHVISGDPALVEPFVAWGFKPGPVPSRLHPERGMDQFRDWFVRAYSR